jgi:hypothetical protein
MANLNLNDILNGPVVVDSTTIVSAVSMFVSVSGMTVTENVGTMLVTKLVLTAGVPIYVEEESGYINDNLALPACCPPVYETLKTTLTDVNGAAYEFLGDGSLVYWSATNVDATNTDVQVNGVALLPAINTAGDKVEFSSIGSNRILDDLIEVTTNEGGIQVVEIRLV